MFLDDGISRDSAPIDGHRPKVNGKATDEKAANKYCRVLITQRSAPMNDASGVKYMRSIEIKAPFNGFGDLSAIVGEEYTIALWHEPTVDINTPQVKSENRAVTSRTDANARVTLVTLPVDLAHTEKGVAFSLTYAEMP